MPLLLALALLWICLSGFWTAWLLVLGVASCLVVLWIAKRIGVGEWRREAAGRRLRPLALARYWAWLLWEIGKANFDVMRRIWHPAMPLSPTVFRVPAGGMSDLAQVTYANSITLTPGTIAINLSDDAIEVHALSADARDELLGGEMRRRVERIETTAGKSVTPTTPSPTPTTPSPMPTNTNAAQNANTAQVDDAASAPAKS